MLILGLESSCDETAAAVVKDGHLVLSDIIASQVDVHARYGGVVPELASRAHVAFRSWACTTSKATLARFDLKPSTRPIRTSPWWFLVGIHR